MAKEAVSQLFRAAQRDPDLKESLNEAPSLEAFIQQANDRGFEFTISEWREVTGFVVEELEGDLSEIPGL
jgi:predicted ribosomally synthesized peptide with nif11-like leader